MRIGSAYERLANGDTNPGGYASSSRQRQHQNPYSRQYQQQQQNYYRQQQYHVSVSFPMGIRAWVCCTHVPCDSLCFGEQFSVSSNKDSQGMYAAVSRLTWSLHLIYTCVCG